MDTQQKLGLALSGGGVRAIAYHCGVLRWLAENHQLENITHISSVSGGSLFTGLLFILNNRRWPTSGEYLKIVLPQIKKILQKMDLQRTAIKRLLFPSNWRFLLSRANVLAQTIEHDWGVKGNLSDLPANPVWSVNGTTAENGRRFRFKRSECGDYELGYADSAYFKIADAMAVSAAFPVGIGPFVINSTDFKWRKRHGWNADISTEKFVTLPYSKLHLYDGGVYDNLGIEPLFDVGQQCYKGDVSFVVVSDAGKPLVRASPGWILNPFRAKRIADIALDQTRSLRVRSFVNYIVANKSKGLYMQLGSNPLDRIRKYAGVNKLTANQLLEEKWLSDDEIRMVISYRTDLRKLTTRNFDILEQHGYETARWNDLMF